MLFKVILRNRSILSMIEENSSIWVTDCIDTVDA